MRINDDVSCRSKGLRTQRASTRRQHPDQSVWWAEL